MIDTHCHLTFKEFSGRTQQILDEAWQAGVRGAITISTASTDCLAARDLAADHKRLWFSAGIHPLHSDEPLDWKNVQTAASHPKCVAWGELGLDNHYDHPPRKLQDKVLAEQLAVIQGIEALGQRGTKGGNQVHVPLDGSIPHPLMPLPIIVHCREAFDDVLAVFRSAPFDPSRYVFHCFTGGPDDVRKVLDFGAWISFTGVVTFANAQEVAAAAMLVPADRIMVETDSPFLTPEPIRKVRPNQPKHVVHIAKRLAELRGVDPQEFERQLDANAERFFNIRLPCLSNQQSP